MLNAFHWFSILIILLVTFAGGYLPLFRPEKAKSVSGFPSGQAFSAGVFLALSLTMMLPSAFDLFRKAFPLFDFPVASIIAIAAFLFLLSMEHITEHIHHSSGAMEVKEPPPIIPIIMTVMIAIPSFFLGTALGISDLKAAIFILIAIMAHKSSAGFALALKMTRSTLTRTQVLIVFSIFACSTPFGILIGEKVHRYLSAHFMLVVKGVILSFAAGTFLYMSTLHELRHTPLIENCSSKKGFLLMMTGLVLTALIRLLLGEVHHP